VIVKSRGGGINFLSSHLPRPAFIPRPPWAGGHSVTHLPQIPVSRLARNARNVGSREMLTSHAWTESELSMQERKGRCAPLRTVSTRNHARRAGWVSPHRTILPLTQLISAGNLLQRTPQARIPTKGYDCPGKRAERCRETVNPGPIQQT
jgi:hypothetical protein